MEGRMKFRVDLQAHKYDDVEERHTVVLKDPVSGKYFYLTVYEYRLLKTLDGNLTLEEAVDRLSSHGYYYSVQEAAAIVGKAAQMGLVLGTKFGTAQFQEHMKNQMETAKKARRLSSIYFAFIPLVNPDKFLEKTLWIAQLFANKFTMGLIALALPGALYCIIAGIPQIQTEYLFFFNLENLVCLWITLAFTKLIHEFAHAYVAKSFGLHVPEMGVAFLIFFPCLFCNTTDAWQLADRRQRMAISAAGILVEGAVAIASTYVWYFTNPGIINSLAFYLMAVSFISTILFNGNPLMRFDGYFILMDLLKLPNLSTRAMAYVKYLFMNRVLGISLVSNSATTPREVFIFTVYGVAAFLYRVFLYTAIVLGVYYRFDKLLGILLALLAFPCAFTLTLHRTHRQPLTDSGIAETWCQMMVARQYQPSARRASASRWGMLQGSPGLRAEGRSRFAVTQAALSRRNDASPCVPSPIVSPISTNSTPVGWSTRRTAAKTRTMFARYSSGVGSLPSS